MTWELKNKIQEILARETGAQCFAPGARRAFAFLYPNSYKVGMSNLGMHILYQIINGRGDTACERFFSAGRQNDGRVQKNQNAVNEYGNSAAACRF